MDTSGQDHGVTTRVAAALPWYHLARFLGVTGAVLTIGEVIFQHGGQRVWSTYMVSELTNADTDESSKSITETDDAISAKLENIKISNLFFVYLSLNNELVANVLSS